MTLTMSGSIGSGSVPVTPFAVEVVELVDVAGLLDVCSGLSGKARPTGQISSTRNNPSAEFLVAYLNMDSLLFRRRCALGGD